MRTKVSFAQSTRWSVSAMVNPSGEAWNICSKNCSRVAALVGLLAEGSEIGGSGQECVEHDPFAGAAGFSGGTNAGGAPLSRAFFRRLARQRSVRPDWVTRSPIRGFPLDVRSPRAW